MKRVIRVVFGVWLVVVAGRAQELNCDVIVNLEAIPSAQRDYLRDFETDIERYLNGTRFTNEDMMGEKIECTISIFFKTVSGENQYQVQAFVGSQRPVYNGNEPTGRVSPVLRLLDDRWEFPYIPHRRMARDDFNFDPLTSFLDFYAYLIIGLDLETYTPNAGSPAFQRAMNIVNLAATTAFGKDWKISSASYSRFGIVSELTDPKYAQVREEFTRYHFDGLDMVTKEPDKGYSAMLETAERFHQFRRLQNPLSVFVKLFFDAKYREIAEVFLSYPDRSIYDLLSDIDQEHRATYQEYKSRAF